MMKLYRGSSDMIRKSISIERVSIFFLHISYEKTISNAGSCTSAPKHTHHVTLAFKMMLHVHVLAVSGAG